MCRSFCEAVAAPLYLSVVMLREVAVSRIVELPHVGWCGECCMCRSFREAVAAPLYRLAALWAPQIGGTI
jgi:hypothetical protein